MFICLLSLIDPLLPILDVQRGSDLNKQFVCMRKISISERLPGKQWHKCKDDDDSFR